MSNEVQVGAQILSGVEIKIATLAAWHPFVDVYVDGTIEEHAKGSRWNVYAITAGTRTLIGSGIFDTPTPAQGQRVLAGVPGDGSTIELWAITQGGATAGAVRGGIVGWDPSTATVNTSDVTDAAVALVPGPETVVAAVVWHPEVAILVQAGLQALGSLWRIRAVIAGFALAIPIAGDTFQDVMPSRLVARGGGGASSWQLTASAPAGPTGVVNAAIFAKSPIDFGAVGGVANVSASLPLTSSGGANPNIAINPATGATAGSLSAADKTKLDGIAVGATNTPLSAVAPVAVDKSAALVGVATSAARSDHKHDITTAAPIETGSSNIEGVAVSLARSDHQHLTAVILANGRRVLLSTRLNPAANDLAQTGMTNFGTDLGGLAAGCIATGATIGGGDGHSVQAIYGTVPGGYKCNVYAARGFAGGNVTDCNGADGLGYGFSCSVQGLRSVSLGEITETLGDGSFSCGSFTLAGNAGGTGDSAFAANSGGYARATNSAVFGQIPVVFLGADQGFAIGQNTSEKGVNGFVSGQAGSQLGRNGFVTGEDCISWENALRGRAGGEFSQNWAEGGNTRGAFTITTPEALDGEAYGDSSLSNRQTQVSFASGSVLGGVGDCQAPKLVFQGTTPGLALGESVTLRYASGTSPFVPENGKAYEITHTILVASSIAGARSVAKFTHTILCRKTRDVVTVDFQGTSAATPVAGPQALYTFVSTGGGTTVTTTFTAVGQTDKAVISSECKWVESIFGDFTPNDLGTGITGYFDMSVAGTGTTFTNSATAPPANTNFVQAVAGNRPTTVAANLNGLAVLRANGVDQFMRTVAPWSSLLGAAGGFVMVIGRANAVPINSPIATADLNAPFLGDTGGNVGLTARPQGASSTSYFYIHDAGGIKVGSTDTSSGAGTGGGAMPTVGQACIMTGWFDSVGITEKVSEGRTTPAIKPQTAGAPTSLAGIPCLFANGAGSIFGQMDIAAMVFMNRAPTISEFFLLLGWAKNKWAL